MAAYLHRLTLAGRIRISFVSSQYLRRNGVACSIWRNGRSLSSLVGLSDFECDEVHDDGEVKKKDNALRHALSELASEFGRESMLSLQRFFSSRRAPVISTGSLKLDLALGIGGLPKGRMVEIFGREASGKTTLAFHIIKEAQKLGGYCAYIDVENALDPSLAESMGVNVKNLLISPPDTAENLLSMVDTLTKSGSIDVIVVDSVAALLPKSELDNVLGDAHVSQSRIMNQALRKIQYSLCQSETLIVFLNQVRSYPKSGGALGCVDEVTCGGNTLKFLSAIRLRMIRTGLLTADNKVKGIKICSQVVKNKLAPAMRKAELTIEFGRGFPCKSEAFDLACEYGIILKEGSSYSVNGKVFVDRCATMEYLASNDGVLAELVMTLRRELFEGNYCRPFTR